MNWVSILLAVSGLFLLFNPIHIPSEQLPAVIRFSFGPLFCLVSILVFIVFSREESRRKGS